MSFTSSLHPHLETPAVTLERLRAKPISQHEIVLVCVVRNEEKRLPHLLKYYRSLGVERFVFIDNLSTDGSLDFLESQADVLLFVANGRYSESGCGIEWSNSVTLALAPANWVLTVDADEYFIFPEFERRSIYDLRDHLEAVSADAIRAPMLDLYPESPLRRTPFEAGSDPLLYHRYFDSEGYEFQNCEGQRLVQRGGPRKRVFWEQQSLDHASPFLMKIPFAKWSGTPLYTASTHLCPDRSFSKTTGLLLHFKFVGDFHTRVDEEARRGEHFADARQYKAYDYISKKSEDLTLFCELSAEYAGSADLIDRELMYPGSF